MPATPSTLDTDTINQAYWAALAEGRLVLQRCECGHRWVPPRAACSTCLASNWTWETARGGGRLKSWVVYHTAFHESFRDRLPYNVALVELDEGPRLITNILAEPSRLRAEAQVRFVPSREGDRTLARFELVPMNTQSTRYREMGHAQHGRGRFAVVQPGLDSSNGVALYAQLAELWRYNILSSKWPSGHRLDNFETLAAQYKVARITVRQAVARLVQEGLLSTRRGRGTVVLGRSDVAASKPTLVGATGSPESLEIEILYNEPAAQLPIEFRGQFKTFPRYREITKLHRLGGAPFAMVRIFVAEPIYQRFPRRALERTKLLRLTFQYGKRAVEQMHQRMTIELADLVVSQHLNCAVGSPVAKILRQTYGTDHRLSYAGLSWYRGDSFEMDITLPRSLVEESSPALIAPGMRAKKS